MSTPRVPSWLEKRDTTVRTMVWTAGSASGSSGGTGSRIDSAASAAAVDAERPADSETRPATASGSGAPLRAEPEWQAIEGALAQAELELERLRGEVGAARRESEERRNELEAARQEMVDFATSTLHDAERELVQLATAVAKRVVARELETAPELVVTWVREALAGSNLGDTLVVAASRDLEERIPTEAWGDLAERVVTDDGLPEGTCELRARGSVVTVSSSERLELVNAHVVETSEREAA